MRDGTRPRDLARAEMTAQILAAARRQLATTGAAALSLRAVAREIGVVSSAVYRYVASRDELLTLLLVEAYDDLGATVEDAARRRRPPAERFLAAARAVRAWALEHPHQYALLYGSPVPGYAAPPETIGPASRTTLTIVGIVADAHGRDRLHPTLPVQVAPALRADLRAIREVTGADLPDDVLVATIAAWTQLFGLVSFELFGQTARVITHHGALFDTTVLAMARAIGLPSARGDG